MREHERAAINFVRAQGAMDVRIEKGGRHEFLRFTYRGREWSHLLPTSPKSFGTSAKLEVIAIRKMLGIAEARAEKGKRRERKHRNHAECARREPQAVRSRPIRRSFDRFNSLADAFARAGIGA